MKIPRKINCRRPSRTPYTPKFIMCHRHKMMTRLVVKYGTEIFDDFDDLLTKPFWNLVDLGKKWGFTRERARQIFFILHGKNYVDTKMKKTRAANEDIVCINNPRRKMADYKRGNHIYRGMKGEFLFLKECEARGFEVGIPCVRGGSYIVNGWRVKVKGSYKAWRQDRGLSFINRFMLKNFRPEKIDYVACFSGNNGNWYIIPYDGKTRCIYINVELSAYYNARNMYWEYEGAWNLLERMKP